MQPDEGCAAEVKDGGHRVDDEVIVEQREAGQRGQFSRDGQFAGGRRAMEEDESHALISMPTVMHTARRPCRQSGVRPWAAGTSRPASPLLSAARGGGMRSRRKARQQLLDRHMAQEPAAALDRPLVFDGMGEDH
ncbi:hypothetical protein OY671_010353, partial [Metschnikowia pulcherrima]